MLSYDVIEHGKPLQARLRETPRPKGREVLVRIVRSGVCHSDLHIWEGFFDLGGGKRFHVKDRGCVPPFTTGHEPFGVVEALGPDADGVAPGDRRIVYPWIGCGTCAVCGDGDDHLCLQTRFVGVVRPGAYASHLVVPDAKYLVDAAGIDEAWAATLACSGLTVHSAIAKLPTLAPRHAVAVLGCGGLGMTAIAMLRARGIERVIACDVDEGKLARAREQGAAQVLDTRGPDPLGRLQTLAGGQLAGVLDFVGMPATATLGIGALCKGGHYVLCGLFGGEVTLSWPPIAQRGISIRGSYVGSLRELHEVVALPRSGRLAPPPIEVRPADQVNRSMTELRDGKVMGRVVLDFEGVQG
ncbi:MAG TPA: alcohol dehydrogenase [Burkholderiaceae bacterium]|nr:alcohol dehydrogenase [Burkholderiaceae bacterium]